ncbi:MAG TPA: hypothetical protein VMT19_03005 [Thermoanaerobaculaceae bacterium]|nr:hypothetical protein [Thermoanaerobaculaceae bacterium]
MIDSVTKGREARNLLERLGARVPGFSGYLERELRREVDQLLRSDLAGRLDSARAGVAAFARSLRLGAGGRLERVASLDKALDALANAVRHAGSGYAGLFDAARVREEQLEALYRFDLGLVDAVDAVREAATGLGEDEATLVRLEQAVSRVQAEFARREQVVQGVFSRSDAGGGGR